MEKAPTIDTSKCDRAHMNITRQIQIQFKTLAISFLTKQLHLHPNSLCLYTVQVFRTRYFIKREVKARTREMGLYSSGLVIVKGKHAHLSLR